MPQLYAMRRRLPWTAILAGAILSGAGPPRALHAERARPVAAHTATGTLAAYEPEARRLTVSSASGSTAFEVASDARVWLGNRSLPLRLLRRHVGSQVTVSWSEAGGVRTTHTVRLVDPVPGKLQ